MKYIKLIILSTIISFTLNSCSSTKTTSPKDGSTVETAIKVKSVGEEYQIVQKLCPDCKLEGQSLISKGNKHYDVLRLTKSNGEKISYYFDINSFYGKW